MIKKIVCSVFQQRGRSLELEEYSPKCYYCHVTVCLLQGNQKGQQGHRSQRVFSTVNDESHPKNLVSHAHVLIKRKQESLKKKVSLLMQTMFTEFTPL